MGERSRRLGAVLGLWAAAALAAGAAAAAEPNVKSIAVGLAYENLARTVVWKGDAAPSRIGGQLIFARADLVLAKGAVLSLSAGAVLTDFRGLTFSGLPISLEYDAAPLLGLAFGAEVVAPLAGFSGFEISGTGRVVYSFGMSKTWPLEGFTVEGGAEGRSSWLEVAAGPRLTYMKLRRVSPYLEVQARWLLAAFKMAETLGDLAGSEAKHASDLSFSAALGADVALTGRLSLRAKAGVSPRPGGLDGLFSAGLACAF